MKSVQIRRFFWFVFSRILTECGKTGKKGPEKSPDSGTFHTALLHLFHANVSYVYPLETSGFLALSGDVERDY